MPFEIEFPYQNLCENRLPRVAQKAGPGNPVRAEVAVRRGRHPALCHGDLPAVQVDEHADVGTPAEASLGARRVGQGGVELRLQIVGDAQAEFERCAHGRVDAGHRGEARVVVKHRRREFRVEGFAPVQAQHPPHRTVVQFEFQDPVGRLPGRRQAPVFRPGTVRLPGLADPPGRHQNHAARQRQAGILGGDVRCQEPVRGLQAADALAQPQPQRADILEDAAGQIGRAGLRGVAHGRDGLSAARERFGNPAVERSEPLGGIAGPTPRAVFPDQRVQPPALGSIDANRFEEPGQREHGLDALH